jgi:hypothetical protein
MAAVRLFRGQAGPTLERRPRYLQIAIWMLLAAFYTFAIHRWDGYLNPPFNYDQCAVDRHYGLGCVHGTVVGDRGKPVSRIEVDLIPTEQNRRRALVQHAERVGGRRRQIQSQSNRTKRISSWRKCIPIISRTNSGTSFRDRILPIG